MESLNEFWALVADVWGRTLFGVGVGAVLTALGIFLAFGAFRSLFARFVLHQLRKLARRTKTTLDDELLEALEPPLRFIPLLLGFFFAVQSLEFEGTVAAVIASLNRSLVIVTIFWAFHRAVDPVANLLNRARGIFNQTLLVWVENVAKAALVLIGATAILEVWGIRVGPLLAGFGLFGVAVALGAQDLFKNLIAGLFIVAERRYNIGDWIYVDGVVEGTVEHIGFRTTTIRRFDKAPVYVPNSLLSDAAMTNFSQMSHRRIYWKIGLLYDTTLDQLRQIRDEIEAHLREDEAFAKPPAVPLFVRVDAFNDSSIDLMLYCFTRTTQWGEWLEIKEALAYRVKEIVEGAGSGFAYPSTSIYVEALPSEVPPPPLAAPDAAREAH